MPEPGRSRPGPLAARYPHLVSSLRSVGIAVLVAVSILAGGCQDAPSPSAGGSPASTAPSAGLLDLTVPHAAEAMVRRLIAAAGTTQLLQVDLSRSAASVSVLQGTTPVTWAWRNGGIERVAADIMYVDQGTFTIDRFNISDLGGLFRQAAVIAKSDSNQELQIVDSSAGEIMMAVSTLPESHTVFFYPDGTVLPTLDFGTQQGIEAGLKDAIGIHGVALAVGIRSNFGAYLDYPGNTDKIVVRRLRTASLPTTIAERSERTGLPTFSPGVVSGAAIWRVIRRAVSEGQLGAAQPWSVLVDDRAKTGTPLMHFTFGVSQVVTDVSGQPVRP